MTPTRITLFIGTLLLWVSACVNFNTGSKTITVSCYDTASGVLCLETDGPVEDGVDADGDGLEDVFLCADSDSDDEDSDVFDEADTDADGSEDDSDGDGIADDEDSDDDNDGLDDDEDSDDDNDGIGDELDCDQSVGEEEDDDL